MVFIETQPGFKLHTRDMGAGAPIVLLHGYCGSADYWQAAANQLSERYRVILPDLRGHGQSDAPSEAYTMDQMADDIVQLAAKLELGAFTLLGHSLGGYVALSVAERYPEKLAGFGLIHSTAYPDSEEAKANRLAAVETIQLQGINSFVDALIPKLFHPSYMAERDALVKQAKEIGYQTPPNGAIGAALAMRARPDRTSVMNDTELPLLLIAGEGDQVVSQERLFTASGEHVLQVVLPQAGHMGMMETPDQMSSSINRFMERYI